MRQMDGRSSSRSRRIRRRPILAVLGVIVLANCSTRVVNTSTAPAAASTPMPRPQQVFVVDFATETARLSLDQGIGPRLQRAVQGDSVSADQQQMLDEVQGTIADTLVSSIQGMGLPAVRVTVAPPASAGSVVVRGQIQTIDEGNRTRRIGIGFGAGKSDVSAQVQVSYERAGAPAQVLQTYDADSNSGHKPGLAIGAASAAGGNLAPAAISGATGVVSEKNKSPVAKEGAKLADRVAYDLGGYFAQQGWIPQSAVPAYSLR